jgi:hypothetical protein
MSRLQRCFLVVLVLLASPAAASAASSSYVYCDNGLRCVKAPCPSNSALDVSTGEVIKGVTIDAERLPPGDRDAPDLAEALYSGRVVVRGSMEVRTRTITGKEYKLPYLVAAGIERDARADERKHCFAR